MWVTSLGLAGEAGIFASLPFYPMFSGVPNGPLRLSPPQVHAAVHNSGDKLPLVHSQLGVALLHAGYSEQAMKQFELELVHSPNDYNANKFLGWLYQQDGQSDRAEKSLRRAYAVKQRDDGVRYLLAQVYHSRRDWEAAGELLEQVVETQPDFMPAHAACSGRGWRSWSGRGRSGARRRAGWWSFGRTRRREDGDFSRMQEANEGRK